MRKIVTLLLLIISTQVSAQGYSFRSLSDLEILNQTDVGRVFKSYDRSMSRLGYNRRGYQHIPGHINRTQAHAQNFNNRFKNGAYSNGITPENIPDIITDVQQIGKALGFLLR